MKNNFLTLTFALLLLLVLPSCKDKSTDVTIVGNWILHTQYQYTGTPRGGAVCFVLNGKAYMGLGYNGKEYPTDFFVLDLKEHSWKQLTNPFPGKGRERAIAFAAAGKGYVGLGYNRDDVNGLKNGGKDFYSYSPETDTWTKETDFAGTARYDAIGFAVKDKGYVGTGLDAKGYYRNDMYQYDPATKVWKAIENFPGGKRNRAFSVTLNDVAYVAGGYNSGSFNNDFWKFNGVEWKPLKPKSDVSYWSKYQAAVNRANANMFSVGGKIYITNGVTGNSTITKKTYEWDPSNDGNEWIERSEFERRERELAISFTLDNRGFVCAGQNSSSYWDDTSELLPNATANGND